MAEPKTLTTRFQTTKCCDHTHCLFMSPEGIKCAWCDFGIKSEPLGAEFEKVLYDNLNELLVRS